MQKCVKKARSTLPGETMLFKAVFHTGVRVPPAGVGFIPVCQNHEVSWCLNQIHRDRLDNIDSKYNCNTQAHNYIQTPKDLKYCETCLGDDLMNSESESQYCELN